MNTKKYGAALALFILIFTGYLALFGFDFNTSSIDQPESGAEEEPELDYNESKVGDELEGIIEDSDLEERINITLDIDGEIRESFILKLENKEGIEVKGTYGYTNLVEIEAEAQQISEILEEEDVKEATYSPEVDIFLETSVPYIGADEETVANQGDGMDVAVIDTGIQEEHTDLEVEQRIDCTDGCEPYSGDPSHLHGTHVAGIIGSADEDNRGVSTEVNLYDLHIGNVDAVAVIEAVAWAVDNDIDVINLSLGREDPQFNDLDACRSTGWLASMESELSGSDTVAIAATGNDGPGEGTMADPACGEEFISVGASDESESITSFSSRGWESTENLEPVISAPGDYITSTVPTNSFESLPGTSMASPHVAGVSALLLNEDSSLDQTQIENLLRNTALDINENQYSQGSGVINASKALNALKGSEQPADCQDPAIGVFNESLSNGYELHKAGFWGADQFGSFEDESTFCNYNNVQIPDAEDSDFYDQDRVFELPFDDSNDLDLPLEFSCDVNNGVSNFDGWNTGDDDFDELSLEMAEKECDTVNVDDWSHWDGNVPASLFYIPIELLPLSSDIDGELEHKFVIDDIDGYSGLVPVSSSSLDEGHNRQNSLRGFFLDSGAESIRVGESLCLIADEENVAVAEGGCF